MSDLDPSATPPIDPTWDKFEAAEQARLEERYQGVEEHNRFKLNMAAGLEDLTLPVTRSGEDLEGAQITVSGGGAVTSVELLLRPDRRTEFQEAGESDTRAWANGEAAIVVGPVPERTQKLMDDLLAGVEAQPDTGRSTPTEEMWTGSVAGQPVWIARYHDVAQVEDDKGEKVELPLISMRAYSQGFIRRLDEKRSK